ARDGPLLAVRDGALVGRGRDRDLEFGAHTGFERVGHVDLEGLVAAGVLADERAVDAQLGVVVDGSEGEDDARSGPGGGRGDRAAVRAVFEPGPSHAGGLALPGERDRDRAPVAFGLEVPASVEVQPALGAVTVGPRVLGAGK